MFKSIIPQEIDKNDKIEFWMIEQLDLKF
jgi:hypothetical protein